MPRASKGAATRRARNRILKAAKGYRGSRSKLYRYAKQAVKRGRQFSFAHRRMKKRQFRSLWVTRVGAACRERGIHYNQFIHLLNEKEIGLNRQMLAQLAVEDPGAFDRIVAIATGKDGV